jgi:hypothetical protein
MNGFYVYAYLRSQSSPSGEIGTPYYIGKGKDDRAFVRCGHKVSPPTNRDAIRFLSTTMSEIDAHQLEVLLIHLYGRLDLGTGCLRNRTAGGEGYSNPSPEARKNMSLLRRGKPLNLSSTGRQHIQTALNRRWSDPDYRREYGLRSRSKCRQLTEESKQKISLALTTPNPSKAALRARAYRERKRVQSAPII